MHVGAVQHPGSPGPIRRLLQLVGGNIQHVAGTWRPSGAHPYPGHLGSGCFISICIFLAPGGLLTTTVFCSPRATRQALLFPQPLAQHPTAGNHPAPCSWEPAGPPGDSAVSPDSFHSPLPTCTSPCLLPWQRSAALVSGATLGSSLRWAAGLLQESGAFDPQPLAGSGLAPSWTALSDALASLISGTGASAHFAAPSAVAPIRSIFVFHLMIPLFCIPFCSPHSTRTALPGSLMASRLLNPKVSAQS